MLRLMSNDLSVIPYYAILPVTSLLGLTLYMMTFKGFSLDFLDHL